MKRYFFIIVLFCISAPSFAQPKANHKAEKQVFVSADQMPSFTSDVDKYIAQHMHYPAVAYTKKLEGKVYVTFVVNEDGSISDAVVKKPLGSGCDEEALRIINGMPKWNPGKQNGHAVNCYVTLPVKFQLVEEAPPPSSGSYGDPNGIDPGMAAPPSPSPAAPRVFTFVEQMPEFPGNMNSFISNNIKYPTAARESGIQGRVNIKFIVNEDGTCSDFQVIRGVGGGCDEEAIRVLKMMPKWKPGKQNGKPVKVYYTLPITFQLDDPAPVKK